MPAKAVKFQDPQLHSRYDLGGAFKGVGVVRNSNALATITQPTLEVTCRGHRGAVTGVSFQHLVRSTASLPPKVVSSGADGAVTLWDSKITHRSLRNTGHHSPVLCCDCSPKAMAVGSGGHNGYAQLWVPNLRRTASTYPATWSFPAGCSNEDDHYQWKAHSGATRAIAFAQDGSDHIYTAGDDKAVKCWDLNYLNSENTTGRVGGASGNKFVGSFSSPPTSSLSGVAGHTNWIHCLAVQGPQTHSSYFHLMASGGDDRCAFLWDVRTQRSVDVLRETNFSVRGLSFHPTGYAVACGDAGGGLHLYDLRRINGPLTTFSSDGSGKSSHSLLQMYPTAHTAAVNDVSFTPDGNWLLSVGDDGNIHLWDVIEGHLYCTLQAHDGPVKTCRTSPDGEYFATGGFDHTVLVWRLHLPCRPAPPPAAVAPRESFLSLQRGTEASANHTRGSLHSTPLRLTSSTARVDEDDELEPRLPPTASRALVVDDTEEGSSHTFRRSEDRLVDSPTLLPSAGGGELEFLQEEQSRMRDDLQQLRCLVESLTQQNRSAPSLAEVHQLRADMQAMQRKQEEEFRDLKGLLTSWMTAERGAGSAAS